MNSRVNITPPQMSTGRLTGDLLIFLCFCLVAACTTTGSDKPDYELLEPSTMLSAPEPVVLTERYYSKEQVAHGKYLVELLGCSTCHTDGALVGSPNLRRLLAGSQTGIAYSDPLTVSRPGVVFPGNLTSDPDTGIGLWNESDIIEMLRTGVNQYGQHTLSVMPWPAYAKITDKDAVAIAAHLMSTSGET